ncbi:ATP synthase F1 subunit epsilon [Candidatus Roizmanbacteria bacterium]|nr:ATP synthase F1 subunit epsilon [Candidatus Roizmanbacteria bacterium]
MLHLRIITPQKIALEEEVSSVTAPSAFGEITILPRHTNLFTLLKEGIIKIKKNAEEDFLAIGGGYLETNGKEINILVSRAYGQDQIDEEQTKLALEEAQRILQKTKDESEKQQAIATLRRSFIDMKLIKRKRRHAS